MLPKGNFVLGKMSQIKKAIYVAIAMKLMKYLI